MRRTTSLLMVHSTRDKSGARDALKVMTIERVKKVIWTALHIIPSGVFDIIEEMDP